MLTSVEGKYRNGKIELNENPQIVGDADVVVTFLTPASFRTDENKGKMITFGMLAVPGRRQSELEDFKIVEFDQGKWDHE